MDAYWRERGRSGYVIWRYRLVRDPADPAPPMADVGSTSTPAPRRQQTTTQRIIRNTRVAQQVKELHVHHCQVCGIRLETLAGPYSEAAHIRPLGAPHNGPDQEDNVLCLCPNHHVLFDLGGFVITDSFRLVDTATKADLGPLRTRPGHRIGGEYVAYHRNLFPH